MVGGDRAAFDHVAAVLHAIGPKVTYIGPNGHAILTKVAINLALVVSVTAFAEGVALAEKAGVDRAAVVDAVLKSVIASPVIGYRAPLLVDDTDVYADVELQQKDLVLAQELARRLGMARAHLRGDQRDAQRRAHLAAGRPRLRGQRARGVPPDRRHGMTPQEPYRTRIDDVPLEQGLREDEGWIDMQVQFLIGERNAGAKDLVVGRTVLPPGARHERHLHPNCDEFLVVLSGHGEIYTNTGREPSKAGDVIYTPRGNWHGFDNTSDEDVAAVLGLERRRLARGGGLRDPRPGRRVRRVIELDDRIARGMREPARRPRRAPARRRAPDRLEGRLRRARRGGSARASTARSSASCWTAGCSRTAQDVPVGSWTKPMLEPEIAVHLARDVARRRLVGRRPRRDRRPVGGDRARRRRPAARGRRAILAGNIFHRHVVLGPVDRGALDRRRHRRPRRRRRRGGRGHRRPVRAHRRARRGGPPDRRAARRLRRAAARRRGRDHRVGRAAAAGRAGAARRASSSARSAR